MTRRQQHVVALKSSDPLPALGVVSEGYAVIKDGRTWVVRDGRWVRGATEPSSSAPTPIPAPSPDPVPSPIGAPSEAELNLYRTPVYLGYQPAGEPAADFVAPVDPYVYTADLVASGGPKTGTALTGDGHLRVTRPGFYRVGLELQEVQTLPPKTRAHLNVSPNGGQNFAIMTHDADASHGFGGGVIYCADPDLDVNNGGELQTSVAFELLGSENPPSTYRASMTLTPILFTGPDNPLSDMPYFTQAPYFDPGDSVNMVQVSLGGPVTSVRARIVDIIGDVSAIDTNWVALTPAGDGGGNWGGNLNVPSNVNGGTHIVTIAIEAFAGDLGVTTTASYGQILS